MFRALFTILFFGCATPVGEKEGDSGFRGIDDLSLVGTTCDEGGIFDCVLECWVPEARTYIGDGECDDGFRGPIFNCAQMNFDNGDCDSAETTGDGSTGDGSTGGSSTGGSSTGGEAGGSTGGEAGGSTGGEAGGSTGGETGGSTGGETGGSTGGSTTGGTTGGSGSATSCVTDQDISYSDSTGTTIFSAPAGSSGYLDCAGTCWPVEGTEGFTGLDGLSYGGVIGNGVCEDGTAPEGFVAPDYNCAEWEYDGGDCL